MSAKFTETIKFPPDPLAAPDSAATLGQVEEKVTQVTEPSVNLTVLFENAIT